MKLLKLSIEARLHHYWFKAYNLRVDQFRKHHRLRRLKNYSRSHSSQVRLLNLSISQARLNISIGTPKVSGPSSPKDDQGVISPTEFSVSKDVDLANGVSQMMGNLDEDGPSAADYNPTMDMREDQMREHQRHHEDEVPSAAYEETRQSQEVLLPEPTTTRAEKAPKSNDDFDMFADNDETDDMFAEQSTALREDDSHEASEGVAVPVPKQLDMSMLDDWDDHEGYYRVILGELLDGRYHVQTNLGKGMFSGVVRAMDSRTKKLVAIKMIRSNETMYASCFGWCGVELMSFQEASRHEGNRDSAETCTGGSR